MASIRARERVLRGPRQRHTGASEHHGLASAFRRSGRIRWRWRLGSARCDWEPGLLPNVFGGCNRPSIRTIDDGADNAERVLLDLRTVVAASRATHAAGGRRSGLYRLDRLGAALHPGPPRDWRQHAHGPICRGWRGTEHGHLRAAPRRRQRSTVTGGRASRGLLEVRAAAARPTPTSPCPFSVRGLEWRIG